jgi:azurin
MRRNLGPIALVALLCSGAACAQDCALAVEVNNIGDSEKTTIQFDGRSLEAGGDYTCLRAFFSDRFVLMNGKLIVE